MTAAVLGTEAPAPLKPLMCAVLKIPVTETVADAAFMICAADPMSNILPAATEKIPELLLAIFEILKEEI